MSRNKPSNPPQQARPAARRNRQPRKPDERARRTRDRLGGAFVALIHEKPIEDVTVQDVLDRASVGRSTFYLHFRDKNDLLLSQLEIFSGNDEHDAQRPQRSFDRMLPWRRCFHTSKTKANSTVSSRIRAVSMISSISRKLFRSRD